MDSERIGKLIYEARINKNMTQKDLANKLHITDKAISKWERGLSIPDISLLIPISNVLDISVYDLLGGNVKEKILKEDAEKVVKTTIEKGIEDNKWKRRIQNIIIVILCIIIILGLSFGMFMIWGNADSYYQYIYQNSPYHVSIEFDYGKYSGIYALDLTNENEGGLYYGSSCYDRCIRAFIDTLPLTVHMAQVQTTNKNKDTIIWSYDYSTKQYNKEMHNDKYVIDSMIVSSMKQFLIINNLSHLKYEFTDKIYTIDKDEVIKFFEEKGISLDDLSKDSVWDKQIINKLKDETFIKEFPFIVKDKK